MSRAVDVRVRLAEALPGVEVAPDGLLLMVPGVLRLHLVVDDLTAGRAALRRLIGAAEVLDGKLRARAGR